MTQYIQRAELIKDAIKARELRSNPGTITKKDAIVTGMPIAQAPKPVSAPKQPQKAEVSVTAQQFVQAGIEAAEKALEHDECFRYEEAIGKYDESIQLFTAALQKETNDQVKTIIKEKLVSYNTRVEQLRQYQVSGTFVANPIKMGLKEGEKYKAPELPKKNSGIFAKKEKKTWDKF